MQPNIPTAGGRINLTASANEADVVIRVQDNGVGISPEATSHIFTMFSAGEIDARSI
ncbi:MAG: ATP-binding protein [Gammaproteobacteria bacterium]